MSLKQFKALLLDESICLLTAVMYLTRLPIPFSNLVSVNFKQVTLEKSGKYFSLVGILVGFLVGIFFLTVTNFFSKELSIGLSIVFSLLLTGSFHEDGLADFADAFGGSWNSKERLLEIMKDSRIGTYGTVALISILGLKFLTLLSIPITLHLSTVIAAHAYSRFLCTTFLFTNDYVRENDKSFYKPMLRKRMSVGEFGVSLVFGLLPFLLFTDKPIYLLIIPLLWIVRELVGNFFISKIGGYTGDCAGAVQQITEVGFYLLVIIFQSWI
jgi:adenosylcobinamide-GDP ribazoletransferase